MSTSGVSRPNRHGLAGRASALICAASMCTLLVTAPAAAAQSQAHPARTFSTPEEAVRALAETVKGGKLDDLLTFFAPDGQDLVASSDPATGRRNREIFTVALTAAGASSIRETTTKCSSSATRGGRSRCRSSRTASCGTSTRRQAKRKFSRDESDETNWQSSASAEPTSSHSAATPSKVTTANPRVSTPGASTAILGSKTVCSGAPHAASL